MILKRKGNQGSPELSILFRVEKQDGEERPWFAYLESIGPRVGGELCTTCPQPERKLCDACAVEEWIRSIGADEWLDDAHVELDQEGVLDVRGRVEWPADEDKEGDPKFNVSYLHWGGSSLYCFIEPRDDGDMHWDPGWYFSDEVEQLHGPFATRAEAVELYKKYVSSM